MNDYSNSNANEKRELDSLSAFDHYTELYTDWTTIKDSSIKQETAIYLKSTGSRLLGIIQKNDAFKDLSDEMIRHYNEVKKYLDNARINPQESKGNENVPMNSDTFIRRHPVPLRFMSRSYDNK